MASPSAPTGKPTRRFSQTIPGGRNRPTVPSAGPLEGLPTGSRENDEGLHALDAHGDSLNNGCKYSLPPPHPFRGDAVNSLLLLTALVASDSSTTVRGQYIEARTCDVF